ncbi:hypothetical protein [Erysipelothrix piscisicarius]|uniref:hypothetical protein n=1 Tax=Erysipelothrix piscisicarius TaxID=2485784 RepID=UPI002F93480B
MINTTCYFILRAGGDTRSTLLGLRSTCVCEFVAVGIATYTTDLSILWLYIVGQSTDILKMMLALRFVNKEKWIVNLAKEEKQEEAFVLEFES